MVDKYLLWLIAVFCPSSSNLEIYALLKIYRAFKVGINSVGSHRSQLFLGVLGGDCIKQRKENTSRFFKLSARLESKGIVPINAIDFHRCRNIS